MALLTGRKSSQSNVGLSTLVATFACKGLQSLDWNSASCRYWAVLSVSYNMKSLTLLFRIMTRVLSSLQLRCLAD